VRVQKKERIYYFEEFRPQSRFHAFVVGRSGITELRHLRDFVAVAEELNFSRAAAKLHLAQPSLTRQIKSLEEEIGVRLFDRIKGRVFLTDHGRSFLVDAKRVLALSAESVRSVQHLVRDEAGQLNIGYSANILFRLLPATLASFGRVSPEVALHLFDMTCAEQLGALETRKIDLGFVGVSECLIGTCLHGECVERYDVTVALPKGSPLSKKPRIDLKDLEACFFAGLSEVACPGSREWIRQISSDGNFSPRVVQEGDAPAVLRFVGASLGVALLPAQIESLPHRGVVFRPLEPRVEVEYCMAWRSDNHSGILAHFIEIVRKSALEAAS